MRSNIVMHCPYCQAKTIVQIPIIDFYIYIDHKKQTPNIIIKKTFTGFDDNREYIKDILINSLQKKPFYSRILITKNYTTALQELTRSGFINPKDLEGINLF